MPVASRFRFQHHFLREGIQLLLLNQVEQVLLREVLVEKHAVVQVLESGYGAQDELLRLVLYVDSRIQQPAAVGALIVVRDLADSFFSRIVLSFRRVHSSCVEVRISPFVAVLVADVQVQLQVLAGQVNAAEPSACCLTLVYSFVKVGILEKSAAVFVESAR